jgi:hypothetical protein
MPYKIYRWNTIIKDACSRFYIEGRYFITIFITTQLTMKKLKLYNQISILIFSVILTGFCGALMLSHNLRAVGKRKIVLPLVIITIVVDGIMFQAVKGFVDDSLLRLLIPNIIAGVVLSYPVWDAYITLDDDELEAKAVWIPAAVAIILYGGLIAGNFIIKH